MAAVARSLSAARSAAARIVPERRQRPHDLRQRPRRQSRLLRHGVSREHVELSRGHLQSQKRRSPQTQRGGGRVEDVVLRLLDESGGERRRVRRRRLMPGASVRAQQLGALRAVEPSFAVAFGTLLGTLLGTPERRGVRADDVISGVDAQHPPRVHHREPILLRQVVDEATRRPDQRLHVPGRGSVSKSGERPVRLHQHLFVHAIGEARRRGGQRRHRLLPQRRPERRQRPKDAIQIFRVHARRAPGNLALHRLHVRRRRRTIHLRARPQTLREVQHARHAPEILRRRLLEQRVHGRRAARIDPIARTPITSWTSPVPRTNEGSPSSFASSRPRTRRRGRVRGTPRREACYSTPARGSRRGCAPPRRTARRV